MWDTGTFPMNREHGFNEKFCLIFPGIIHKGFNLCISLMEMNVKTYFHVYVEIIIKVELGEVPDYWYSLGVGTRKQRLSGGEEQGM